MADELIPDVFCETLLCSQCGKYLSVSPVKLYVGGTVKCGRCCESTDDGVVSPWCMMVLKKSLFKCVNRYEGCTQLLKPSEVLAHEESCKAGNHKCQECFAFDGTMYEMVRHYKRMHPSRILNKNAEITIDVLASDLVQPIQRNYMVLKKDIVHIVMTRLSANKFEFNTVLAKEYQEDIYCSFVLFMDNECFKSPIWQGMKCVTLEEFGGNYYSLDGNFSSVNILKLLPKLTVKTEENLDSEVLLQPVSASKSELKRKSELENEQKARQCSVSKTGKKQCEPLEHLENNKIFCENAYDAVTPDIFSDSKKPVKMSKQFKRNFPDDTISECGTTLVILTGEKIDLLCSNCEEYYGINLFKCTSGEHWLCRDCNHYCSFCKEKIDSPNVVTDYLPKLLLLLFPCPWPLCNKYVMGFEKVDHESNCDLSILKCPTCCIIYSLPKMKLHVSTCHNSTFLDYPIQDLRPYMATTSRGAFYLMNNFHIISVNGKSNGATLEISSKYLTKSKFHFDVIVPSYYDYNSGLTMKTDFIPVCYNMKQDICYKVMKQTKRLLVYSKRLCDYGESACIS